MQGTSLTKQERECKLYDAFDNFAHIKRESLHHYYLRFTQLINDMNIYKMKLEQFQVNTKFLNSLPPKWSKFVTDVKLVRDLHTTNFDQLHAYLEQHELHANEVLQGRQSSFAAGTSGTRANILATSRNNSSQQRVVKCFNCQGEGHMARQCPKSKRKRDATWFRDKVLLVEAQGPGKVLNKEELEFLADPGVAEGPITQTFITHNATYQADDFDAYDSDCDDFFTAKAVLMANLSSYGLDVLSEVSHSENTHNDMLNQSGQEMPYSGQTHFVNYPENEITSDSNIIPCSQYLLETQNAVVQDTNSSAQQDAMILSVFEQLSNQVTNCNKVNKDNLIANESLSSELERYKERVKLLEERQNVDLSTQEKLIMDDIIREKNAQFADFEKEINYLKQTLSEQSKEKELLTKTFNVFKNESKEKEAKNIDKEIALEKKVKELDNIVCKMGQSAQTVHMLTKPQVFYDNNLKQALGFQNPFYLKKAQQIRPMLYDGSVIAKETNVISIADSEETLMLEEESRSKMLLKQSDPMVLEKKVNIKPINYAELNRLSEDFGKRFVPQQELSDEQAFRLQTSHPNTDQSASSPVKIEAPRELPKVSLVNTSLKKLKYHLGQFDNVVKKRITPDALTEGEWGEGDKDLLNEVTEVQTVFNQMEAAVQQYFVDKQCFEIKKKQFLIENNRLLDQIISQDIMNIVVHSSVDMNTSVNVHSSVATYDSGNYVKNCNKCLKLKAELIKQRSIVKKDEYNRLSKSFSKLEQYCISLKLAMEIVEQAKSLNPLDSASYSACKYVKLIQELLGYVRDACLDIHKPSKKLDINEAGDKEEACSGCIISEGDLFMTGTQPGLLEPTAASSLFHPHQHYERWTVEPASKELKDIIQHCTGWQDVKTLDRIQCIKCERDIVAYIDQCISTTTAICIPLAFAMVYQSICIPLAFTMEDIDIVNEVQCHIKNGSDMALPSTLYLLAKDGYNPQCDIDFEEGCNLKHSVLEILVTHEMDEAYLVIDEAPQSNIHAEVKSTCYSDDSDSEVFRVKRGSSIKPQHRKAINFVPSKPEHQMTGLDHLEPHVEKKEPVWIVFEVLGSIKLASYLNVSSYKTIDGQGQRSKFTSKGLRLKECEHVIVCNLEFKGGRGRDVDAIKIKRNSKQIWIRCSLQDYDDGLIDIIEKAQILPFLGKGFCHNNIKNDLRKFKGKDIVDNVAQVSNATTIAPGMCKLNPITLAPKDKNNRETHIYYLKHAMEQAVILKEIVEQAKSLNLLDSASYYALSRSTKSSRSKSTDNTKNDRILQISSST
ncbi:retrovirus-related pol polyprotein from transposon TNT 1-94 [Tanacetum coccineum]